MLGLRTVFSCSLLSLPSHSAVSGGRLENTSVTNSCSRPPIVPLLSRVIQIAPKASLIFWTAGSSFAPTAEALTDKISMDTSRRRSHGWSAAAKASHASLKGVLCNRRQDRETTFSRSSQNCWPNHAAEVGIAQILATLSARSLASDTNRSCKHPHCPCFLA